MLWLRPYVLNQPRNRLVCTQKGVSKPLVGKKCYIAYVKNMAIFLVEHQAATRAPCVCDTPVYLLHTAPIRFLVICKLSKLALRLEKHSTNVIHMSILIPPHIYGSNHANTCLPFLRTVTCTSIVIYGTEELSYSSTYNFDDNLGGYLHSSKPYILGSLEALIWE